MILSKVRDPRLVTIRRGGTLTDADHCLLALWPAACAEHVLGLFKAAAPTDARPRRAIEAAPAWTRGEVTMMQARAVGGPRDGRRQTAAGGAASCCLRGGPGRRRRARRGARARRRGVRDQGSRRRGTQRRDRGRPTVGVPLAA